MNMQKTHKLKDLPKKSIMKKKKGFTLIEVMVVISMLVVLAGILIPKVTGYISEVRKVQVVEQARKVVLAVESINIKAPTSINKKGTISSILSLTEGLLSSDDVTKLNPDTNTVQKCYNVVESEKFTFTLDNNNCLKNVVPISK